MIGRGCVSAGPLCVQLPVLVSGILYDFISGKWEEVETCPPSLFTVYIGH